MLYKLESENDTEYFFVCKYLQGRIGTGIGPEFNSEDYRNRGAYIPELINIDDVGESLLPKKISNLLINDLKSFAKLEFAPQKTLRQFAKK